MLRSGLKEADLKAARDVCGDAEHSIVDDGSGVDVKAAEWVLLGLLAGPGLPLVLHLAQVAILDLVNIALPAPGEFSLGKWAAAQILLGPASASRLCC